MLRIREYLTEHDITPAEKIVELIPYLEPSEQVKAWLCLAAYCEPKPVEADAPPSTSNEAILEELKDVSNARLIHAIEHKEKEK